MPKTNKPYGIGSLLQDVLDITKVFADTTVDGVSVAERAFREGLVKLIAPEDTQQSRAGQAR